jgi:hypothetical protein
MSRSSVVLGRLLVATVIILAAGSATGQVELAPAPRPGDDRVSKLVAQLSAPEYRDREAAQKQLRKVGIKAEAAIRGGLRSADPEVVRRCDELLNVIRTDFLTGTESPVWLKFRDTALDDEEAWRLYLRMVGTPQRREMLLAALGDPKAAAASYAKECERMAQVLRPVRGVKVRDAQFDDLAVMLFLGILVPGEADRNRDELKAVDNHILIDALGGKSKKVFGRLYAAWIEPRPDMWQVGMFRALANEMSTMAGVARQVLLAKDDSPWRVYDKRLFAMRYLGLNGRLEDVPLLMKFVEDKTECDRLSFSRLPGGRLDNMRPVEGNTDVVAQVRDVAIVAALQIHKQSPKSFGFERAIEYSTSSRPFLGTLATLGFCREAHRDAAHQNALTWLARHVKE